MVKTLLLFLCMTLSVFADGTFQVGGAVQHPIEWTAGRLRTSLPVKTIYYRYRGADHSGACISLWSVLDAAGLPTGADKTGTVTVQGADGYRIVFSLSELSPQFGNEPVWLALDEDGAPLSADLSPARLVVPGDVKLGRWVHNIVRITVSTP